MLDDKTMTSLEALIGLEGGALKEAIESDDSKEITIPEGQFVDKESTVFTSKELLQRDDKLKIKYEEAGKQIVVKDYKKANDIEYDGKTIEALIKFTSEKAVKNAGIEPNDRITELETKNGKLVTANEDWEKKHGVLVESNAKADVKRGNDTDVLSFMGGEYSIPKSDMLTIFNSKHEIGKDGDKRVVSRGGEKLEDSKTFEPLGLKSIVEDFTKQYAKNPEGGNGGGNEGGGGSGGSLAAFNKRMETQGHNKGSETYMQEYNKSIEDKTLVI